MVFVAIGCDFSKFGLNFGNEEESGETNKPNEEKPVETPNEEDEVIQNLLKYFYDQQTMPYSFTTWFSKFENSDIRIIRDNDTFYFTDATNNRYLYFTFSALQNNPLNIEVLDTASSIFIKVNNRWIQLFSYDVVSITTKYNVFIYDGFGNLIISGEAEKGETVLSVFQRLSVTVNHPGYTLVGWNINNSLYSSAELSRFFISSNLTIQAVWQEEQVSDNKVEVVIYTYNGIEVARGEFDKGIKASTVLNTLLGSSGISRITNLSGFNFEGWYIPFVDHTVSSTELSSIAINEDTTIQVTLSVIQTQSIRIQVYSEDGTVLYKEGNVPSGVSIPEALRLIGYTGAARQLATPYGKRSLSCTSWSIRCKMINSISGGDMFYNQHIASLLFTDV